MGNTLAEKNKDPRSNFRDCASGALFRFLWPLAFSENLALEVFFFSFLNRYVQRQPVCYRQARMRFRAAAWANGTCISSRVRWVPGAKTRDGMDAG